MANIEIKTSAIITDGKRLTNQLWKLIPMRENDEDWEDHLHSILVELIRLSKIFSDKTKYLILISKLTGLTDRDIKFSTYRKTVFESISLIRELMVNDYE